MIDDATRTGESPPPFLRNAMWSLWAAVAATTAVVSNAAWHARQTHRPGSSLATLEIVLQVLAACLCALLYRGLKRSGDWPAVHDGAQGVSAATLGAFAGMVSLMGLATAGCAVWFFIVPWGTSANAALLSALAIGQPGLAGQMIRDVRRRPRSAQRASDTRGRR